MQVLIRTIRAYIASWNTNPRPFQWTATTDEILAKARLTQLNIKKLVANNSKKGVRLRVVELDYLWGSRRFPPSP
ncbi:hypothetical protein ACIBSW_33810 [Actinoplanes sp. NPDC049668]|uniref:hypothetical protein n=1 Tax=unclassified Actinoplanes TaxID=2626549 RepID=UPI0033BEE200